MISLLAFQWEDAFTLAASVSDRGRFRNYHGARKDVKQRRSQGRAAMVAWSRRSFRLRKSYDLCATLFTLAYFAIFGAAAGTFPIPPDHPAARIDVPDDWRPMSIGGGVEGSASNVAVRLAVQFTPGSDLDAATATATANLARRGVAVDPESRREARRRYNGFDALKIDYTGTDPNGESDITIILIALPEKSGFVAVCTWGDDEAQESVSNDLQAIADSVRVAR
jgi:hypothetical protein